MCRLCLSSGVALLDIFRFSIKMESSPADVITKCAPVQISRGNEMPNFICQPCYTQVEKIHQFLKQIEQSDRTLQRYLQQIHASGKAIKAECSVQHSEDPLIFNTNQDTAKCESSELRDVFDMHLNWGDNKSANFNRENKNNEEIYLKSEIKDEPIDDGTEHTLSNVEGTETSCEESKTKVGEDMIVNWKRKEPEKYPFPENVFLKSEIIDEPLDDNLLTPTELVDGRKISCEDTNYNIGEKPYKCDICNMCLATFGALKTHTLTHTGEKPYQCDICKKFFSQSSNLNRHMIQHTGEKPYQCDFCNNHFFYLHHLNSHMRIHTGERPYQCDLCNKRFSNSANLNIHKRTHNGEKPYQCDLCKMCFSQSSNLNRHKVQHTSEKPYQCDSCNKCFSHLRYLNSHKRTHTGEKPYQCDVCNKCFSRSHNLTSHKRTHTVAY